MTNFAFIGYGNMARAIVQGMTIEPDDQVCVASPSSRDETVENIRFSANNRTTIATADVVMLCVKPNQIATVLSEIGHHLPNQSVLLSVAAGTGVDALQSYCRADQAIVRSMPNTPIAIGLGATPLYSKGPLTANQKQCVERVFQPASLITWLTEESALNAYTALSGSGPAYVFLFIEALMEGAKRLGLNEQDARAFTVQTLLGATTLFQQSTLTPAQLRKQVTSLGGTTEAALEVLQSRDFETLVIDAMQAAHDRALVLGGGKP